MSKKLYEILLDINVSLAELTVEIEKLIYVSPRAAMQTIRTMAETLARHISEIEKIESDELSFSDLQMKLNREGILTPTVDQAFQFVRRNGNVASHDATRKILIREALFCWEYQHLILTWYIETYASPNLTVPTYIEPLPSKTDYESEEIILHIQGLINRLEQNSKGKKKINLSPKTVREIYYKDQSVEVPHFLRDAFLLPQRFPKSTTFLIRLNGEQQARLMSELPYQIDGLHKFVKRFNESNDARFFEELCQFIQEEKERKELKENYSGETLLFYKAEHVILTEKLANVELTKENFVGQTSLLRALHEQGFERVSDLPKELVLLGKYPNVGEVALANLFNQLKMKSLEFSEVEFV
ncbi:DUF4145 domain-containing protein [Sporosarcina ureilytica]|uniref:DUF4145 domain-containing protein n=1 Tax=Sporosarcina ureilytica TaxID=298596 RepID=A0A1D8JF93_9BACL|nr:DUF4145 domain-containing protein [Sporosarcina ureilytica]AOV07375.1 hypothetical protein BI350_07370 [Sporosarcina ureilytica]